MAPKPKIFYGWIISLLSFMAASTYGLFFSYSVFIQPLEAELHASRAAISSVYTLYMIIYGFCAIPMGWISDRYGPRTTLWLAAIFIGSGISLCSLATSVWALYLFFGLIASIGHGAVFVVPTSTINRWFVKRKGLAVGIAVSGVGFGLLVVPPITAQIVHAYGWKSGFLFLGILFFVVNALVATFIKARPADMGLKPYGEDAEETTTAQVSAGIKDYSVIETLREKGFWMLYLVTLLTFAAEQMTVVHIVPYSTDMGMSVTKASLGLSLLGIGTIIGRVISGAISDRIGRILTLVLCCGIEAVAILYLLAVKGPASLYLAMFVLGIGYGGWVVLISVLLGEFYGLKNLGTILGLNFTAAAPAGILGPLMGGMLFDLTHSYFLAILIAGIICIVAVVLAALTRRPQTADDMKMNL